MWSECGWRYKLVYKDKVPYYSTTPHTTFGTAIHATCENVIFGKETDKPEDYFLNEFKNLSKDLVDADEKLLSEMKEQGQTILPQVQPAVSELFGDYEVFSLEEELFHNIDEQTNFKGYIDMVLKTKDGKYHIIDWKTCSWGWNAQKKSDKLINYQLTLYKNYFCHKHGVDAANVETYFGLLKRTPKKNNVEIFRVTSGNKKMDNALKSLDGFIYNSKKDKYFKNRLSCQYCSFYKTEHCG